MTIKEQIESIKKEWVHATTEAERQAADAKLHELSESDPEAFEQAFYESALESVNKVKTHLVRDRMSDVLPMINLSYIAEHYFHRSRGWLSQRMAGARVNGRPAVFSSDGVKTMAEALADMGQCLLRASERVAAISSKH